VTLLKPIRVIVHAIGVDPNLQAVCLVSALGLALSIAVLPHTRSQLVARPLLYAQSEGAY